MIRSPMIPLSVFMFGDIPLNLMSSITGILLMTCLKKWRIKRMSGMQQMEKYAIIIKNINN